MFNAIDVSKWQSSINWARQEARCCLEIIKGLKPTMPVEG